MWMDLLSLRKSDQVKKEDDFNEQLQANESLTVMPITNGCKGMSLSFSQNTLLA